MLKYLNAVVTLAEIPDEIALCINITNCPIHCVDCHSKQLWNDIGIKLNEKELDNLIYKNEGISCVTFMGGDSDVKSIQLLATHVKLFYPNLKVAWYSGRQKLNKKIKLNVFDYIKLGPFIKEKGPLNNPNTNQKFFKVDSNFKLEDITYKFWKNE